MLLIYFLILPYQLKAQDEQFNFTSLTSLISSKKITSMDKLIEVLPDDLKKNYTLMRTSRSLHEASYEKPRAILFGNTGNLIVTFNSDSSQKGGNAMEIMEFTKTPTPRFEMREIEFDPDGKNPPKISKSNPAKCLVCHGNPPRPIWGDYNDANSGVYGASIEGLSKEEKEQYKIFRKEAETHPRYSKLHLPKEDEFYPYSDQESPLVKNLPNLRLASLLISHLVETQGRKITEDPYISTFLFATKCSFELQDQKYIDALTALLAYRGVHSDISEIGNNISSDQLKMKKYFSTDSVEGPLTNRFFYPAKIREAFKIGIDDLSLEFEKGKKSSSESGFFHDSKIMLRNYLLEHLKKKHPDLGKSSLESDFKEKFAKQLEGTDPQFISALSSEAFFSDYNEASLCKELKPLMKHELDRPIVDDPAKCHPNTARPSVATGFVDEIEKINKKMKHDKMFSFQKLMREKSCVECHDQAGVIKSGPEMPLLNELELTEKLKQNKNLYKLIEERTDPEIADSIRMPLGQPALTKKEREEVLEYLKSLMD